MDVDLVLGLPRGGVVVAAEVARLLQCPLDVLVVRKIGHPWHREFAVGALAEPDVVIFDEASLSEIPAGTFAIGQSGGGRNCPVAGILPAVSPFQCAGVRDKIVLLVDDGLATGATAEAAVLSARQQSARRIIVAAPVASTNAVERLRRVADDVLALVVDPDFAAVGQYYDEFSQTSDEEVLALLRDAARMNPFDAVQGDL